MPKVRIALVSLFLLLHVESALALSLTAKVDKTEATIQDQIILTLSVEGTQRGARPHLPPIPSFNVMSMLCPVETLPECRSLMVRSHQQLITIIY